MRQCHVGYWGFAAILLALSGCKIRIEVPEGGTVTTVSGAYECHSGQTCLIDIYDLYFAEEFVAVPDSGYRFVEWETVDRGLCLGQTAPCKIVSALATVDESLLKLLESDEVFLLKPVFESSRRSDLGIRLLSYGYTNSYCNAEGKIDYEVLVWNAGPRGAKDVVVTFEEEGFEVPEGWKSKGSCKNHSGRITCHIGDLDATPKGHDGVKGHSLVFRSKAFKNTRHQRHRVKFTVSGATPDPNPTNNVYFWERTIPSFPNRKISCERYNW